MIVIYLYILMLMGTVWDREFLQYLFVSFLIAYFYPLPITFMMIIVISDVFRECSRERFDFYGLGQVALPSSIQDNSLIQKLLVARMSLDLVSTSFKMEGTVYKWFPIGSYRSESSNGC